MGFKNNTIHTLESLSANQLIHQPIAS